MVQGAKYTYLIFGLFAIVQLGLHSPIFQKDLCGLHVWRQTQTQNTINSFVEEDFNILNPRRNERGAESGIFRMEFPLMQWFTALAAKVFGNSVLVSRLANFLFVMFGFIGFYQLTGTFLNDIFLRRSLAILFWFSPLLYYYMVNPMPDNLALAFGIWGLYFLQRWIRHNSITNQSFAAIFLALAALVKLPFVIYFAAYFWVLLFPKMVGRVNQKDARIRDLLYPAIIGFVSLIPVLAWYIWVIPDWTGNGIVQGIFKMTSEQKTEYLYYIWFHVRTTLPEIILGWPMVPIFVIGLWATLRKAKIRFKKYSHWILLLLALLFFLLFEMNMIEKVHDYYFMPVVPFVFIITGAGLQFISRSGWTLRWKRGVIMLLLILLPVYSFLRMQGRWDRIGFNEDLLTYKNELRNAVPNDELVCVGNDPSHHIFLYYVQKMGWAFENDWINHDILSAMIREGCRYLYCDSRKTDQNSEISALFGMKVAEFGTVRVYELKSPEQISGK
jgi:hypothetical protein